MQEQNQEVENIDYAIEVKNLVKNFQKGGRLKNYTFMENIKRHLFKGDFFCAVDKVSFKVRLGEVFCLLGPNGAGKTTTIKMLSTIIQPDSGCAKINGLNVCKNEELVKKEMGVMMGH